MAKTGAIGYQTGMPPRAAPEPDTAMPAPGFRVSRVAAVLATALLLWGTLSPQAPAMAGGLAMADKLWHAVAFWGWAGLVSYGWARSAAVIMVAALGLGGLIEYVQPLAGREAELADLGADLAGAACGIMTGRGLVAMARRRAATGADR